MASFKHRGSERGAYVGPGPCARLLPLRLPGRAGASSVLWGASRREPGPAQPSPWPPPPRRGIGRDPSMADAARDGLDLRSSLHWPATKSFAFSGSTEY